jgi:hypothetical protein
MTTHTPISDAIRHAVATCNALDLDKLEAVPATAARLSAELDRLRGEIANVSATLVSERQALDALLLTPSGSGDDGRRAEWARQLSEIMNELLGQQSTWW